MLANEKRQDAIDLSHHLSDVARARTLSPLKGLQKYMNKPGLISLAGGLPSAAYFPFSTVSGEVLVPDSFPLKIESEESSSLAWFWKLFSRGNKERTTSFTVGKYPKHPEDINLETGLQYSMAGGQPKLNEIIHEFTEKVYQPAYRNWTYLVHTGNTFGWFQAAQTLLNPGEGLIVSEWTYPSALASSKPYGFVPVPVGMDGEGMSSESLRKTLAEWDESARGMRRPHVLYTVPVGQNPTGTTMGLQRKKEIYDICVEYDIIIVEDDPYYFLQEGKYAPKSERVSETADDDEAYIASLVPSYLKLDYQGRVIRLDTFSKTIAPGSRLGWFTCNPLFKERLERAAETTSQAPCGFSQINVASLLLQWHYDGYIRWLKALRLQYKQRRDYFVDCFAEEFRLEPSISMHGITAGALVYHASLKSKSSFVPLSEKDVAFSKPLFSFIPPTSGMFLWIELHLEDHPSFATLGYKELELKLWTEIADAGVLFGPGAMFSATPVENDTPGHGHFRVSFSNCSPEELKKAVTVFGNVLKKFMKSA